MDQKAWLWRKRSSEKTIITNGEEEKSAPNEKEVYLEASLKDLNEKLVSVLDECSAKDKLVKHYEKIAEDAASDKHKADEEIKCLKQELDEVQKQKAAANDRLGHLNSALKECMEQLNQLREEQDRRIHDAVAKTSQEFEKKHKEKLTETSKRLADVTVENTYLAKAILVKEKLIEDLNCRKSQTEAEFGALMTRLDSIEKENAFLRYEFRTLEKELHLRKEELEYSRRSAESSHKQNQENMKKIKKLESDCQRLRALTRKRLPSSPSVFANLKSDVEMQSRDNYRRKKGINGNPVVRDLRAQFSPESPNNKIGFLTDHVEDLEKENEILRQCLVKKEEEIFYLRKIENSQRFDSTMSNHAPDELSFTSGYEIIDSNDVTRSWDANNGLVSGKESDSQNGEECKMIGASEMSLMDDFVEMEKLAIVAADPPPSRSFDGSDSSKDALVPLGQEKEPYPGKPKDWLRDVKNLIMEQKEISDRSLDEILEEIKMALHSPESSKLLPISGYIAWKSPTSPCSTFSGASTERSNEDTNSSLTKIIELVNRLDSPCSERAESKNLVFRWERTELASVLRKFIRSCSSLSDGKISSERFIQDMALVLGWIVDGSISYQDHSTIRDEFKKHLGSDGPGTAMGLESVQNLMFEIEKIYSVSQAEISGLKKELNAKSMEYEGWLDKFQKSEEKIASLKDEMEILRECKRMVEDQNENQKVMNEDLDTHLSVAKAKMNELMQKLSSVEVELENKRHCCEELEGTCVELQLQLESGTSNNKHSDDNENQEELLRTGMEITKASAKLAECEKTILNLGKQLKALGSAKELSVVDRVLSITTSSTSNSKKLKQRSSLRDHILSEDIGEAENQQSPKTKEIISMTETNPHSMFQANAFSFPDGQATTLRTYQRLMIHSKNGNPGALITVPTKKKGGVGFLKKLLQRRKRATSKNTSHLYFN